MDMPELKDFYAFKSTSSEQNGCSLGCLPYILGTLFVLWLIGKLFC